MRKINVIMGMPISIDIADSKNETAVEAAFARLREIDDIFSTYKPHSEISRFQNGTIREPDLSQDVRTTKKAIESFERMTNGYFTAYFNGTYNPTGYIKGWAIAEAAKTLKKSGITTYLINAAGDITAASSGQKTWHIALQNPFKQRQSLGTISLKNGAIATSGTYERGSHIINPHTGKPANDLVSATVYGSDVVTADVFATTCIAMGAEKAIDFIEKQVGYEALLIDVSGGAVASQGFAR